MATYFPGSNNGRDAAPMLYSREALPSSYTESTVLPGNMMMHLSFSSGSYSEALHGNLLQQNSCINMSTAGISDSILSEKGILSNLGESGTGELDLNAWRPSRTDTLLLHPMATGIFRSGQNLQSQGLSLTLGTQVPSGMQVSSLQYQNDCQGFCSFSSSNSSITGQGGGRNGSFRDDGSQNKKSRNTECIAHSLPGSNSDSIQTDVPPYGMSGVAGTIPNSKYLNAAQQLLEEVVNIQKAPKQHDPKTDTIMHLKEVDGETKNDTSSNPQESTIYSSTGISAAEKQNLENKMTKLLSMSDEVDRRYKQYYHQMQIVVSSFDVIAGSGAAKPYTSLALQTISQHFRCLRDAINGQVQVARRSLGETDSSETSRGIGISRLRYVDQQLRQQRALQQLGMMQPHAWRPQRGLPQSSVSILRAWLFEHFLHPYPKDSDKIMLARQTGLTRSQVSNWFINARVRLWKPMVEEMYKEETGDTELDSNSLSDIAPNAAKVDTKSRENGGEEVQQSGTSATTERCSISHVLESKWNHVSDIEMAGICGDSSFHGATEGDPESQCGARKYREEQGPAMINVGLFQDTIIHPNVSNEKLKAAAAAAFHMPQLGRFGSQSGVSLTLGLQQCEGGSLPVSVGIGTHQSFVSMRGEDFHNAASSSRFPETTDFDVMDSGSLQQRFGSPHLLHDSVA